MHIVIGILETDEYVKEIYMTRRELFIQFCKSLVFQIVGEMRIFEIDREEV